MIESGRVFQSETDTELISHVIAFPKADSLEERVREGWRGFRELTRLGDERARAR